MKDLIKSTKLPASSILGDAGAGIKLSWLKSRQEEWIDKFDWKREQDAMNKFNHSTVDIGNMTVHFIHQKSSDPQAVPVILTHGWPGSFYEFHEVITPLSNPGKDSNISFNVVVPSLPGFGFSSPAPNGWTTNDTATLFDTLMTQVLGYEKYAAVGGDWGCIVTWALQNNHADHVGAADEEKQRLKDNVIFGQTGNGYFIEMATRPATIGMALYDNPIGQLAWMGQLFIEHSDPHFGVPPTTLTNNTILTAVSIYYLTGTFETAGNIYFQNPTAFYPQLPQATNSVPIGFASYRYEAVYYPKFYLSDMGNLVFYSEHPRGGHFSALDNPPAYVNDIRGMMDKWF
ncbi:epoxide hydrolase [Ceratobasidium sp. AG-Ba]|nr:epoxide hydrolase [Ceratobasidium sp. AG-Ba]